MKCPVYFSAQAGQHAQTKVLGRVGRDPHCLCYIVITGSWKFFWDVSSTWWHINTSAVTSFENHGTWSQSCPCDSQWHRI